MMTTISTNRAKCRDCYRCIRECPVKAIGFRNAQAWILDGKCIECGRCTRACPQGAKTYSDSTGQVLAWIRQGRTVVASLAPSYPAVPLGGHPHEFIGALKSLGFSAVHETAVAAELVACEYRKLAETGGGTFISACCPVVVNLIEIYYPDLIPLLSPTVSPMTQHARMLKEAYGRDARVVFIGPCIAKIGEAARPEAVGFVDAVLTFDQVLAAIGEAHSAAAASPPDASSDLARVFPLESGILATAGLETALSSDIVKVSGVERCMEAFEDIRAGRIAPRFVEALACEGGCVGGMGLTSPDGSQARMRRVIEYSRSAVHGHEALPGPGARDHHVAHRTYTPRPVRLDMPTEEQIREILALTGKTSPADERNCGGCGYATCRDKAIAVFQGLAQPEMCVPYMKDKFESLSHLVVESSLNAIVIVNGGMIIQEFNPAARALFRAGSSDVKGIPLSAFIDPSDFEAVFATGKPVIGRRVEYPGYGIVTRQTIYPIPAYGLVVGIITDITEEERKKAAAREADEQTIRKAKEVINRQMRLAQEIAGLLGEATSESKAILLELLEIVKSRAS